MPFLVIVSFLPLSLSVSCYPLAFSPFFSLWILHCSSLFSTISQNWVIDRLCSTILKNMGGGKKNTFLLWEQSKVSLTSTPLIKLSCQKHINNRQHNSLHRERGGGGGWVKAHSGKKKISHSLCKETVNQGQWSFSKISPSLFFCPTYNMIMGSLLWGAKMQSVTHLKGEQYLGLECSSDDTRV